MENIEATHKNCALIYSSDDDYETGKGFYWQKEFGEWRVSKESYKTEDEAKTQMINNKVKFK